MLFKDRDYVIRNIIDCNNGIIPKELLIERTCPHCSIDNSIIYLSKDLFNLVKCSSCELVYVNPSLNPSKYVEIYQQKNYGHIVENLAIESHEYRKNRFGTERMDLITKYSNSKVGKILDIGSGSGFFVEEAISRGWDGLGLELSGPAHEFALSRKIPSFQCTLEEMNFRDNEFDVVTAFDVLEHIYDPKTFVNEIKRILKPFGILFVYVPNLESASFHLLGESAHFIWPTHHLTYFTPNTLKDFFKSLNFKDIFLETKGLDIEDYIWQRKNLHSKDVDELSLISEELQFYINASGFGKNLRIILENIKSNV